MLAWDFNCGKIDEIIKQVKLSLNRVSFIFFIFLVVAFVFGSKIIYLASIKKENYFTNKSVPSIFLRRQDILDRNNVRLHPRVYHQDPGHLDHLHRYRGMCFEA